MIYPDDRPGGAPIGATVILRASRNRESRKAVRLLRRSGISFTTEEASNRQVYTPTLCASFGTFSGIRAIGWLLAQLQGMAAPSES